MRLLICSVAIFILFGCGEKDKTQEVAQPIAKSKTVEGTTNISAFEGLDYPGAKLAEGSKIMGGKNDDGSGVSGQFTTNDAVGKVLDYYKTKVEVTSNSLAGENGTVTGKAKSGKILNVLAMKESGKTVITLSLANEKK